MAKLTEEERKALGGSVYDQQNFTDDELKAAAEVVANAKSTGDWDSAHSYVEGIRSKYGYSGGDDGSAYNALKSAASSTPTYQNKYSEDLQNAIDAINNRAAFSYDYATDPSYQAYKKQYTREGQRATADTLGQYASMTGGMPSTAAVNAATQQGDYYSAQLSDKIPELYNAAYSMYQDETNNLYNNYNMYKALYDSDYNEYLNQLSQYNTDRSFNYGVDQDAQEAALNRISALLDTGDTSLISDADIALSGYTRDQLAAIANASQNTDGDEGTELNEYDLYQKVVQATGSTTFYSPDEFNQDERLKSVYGTYENYCNKRLAHYGIDADQLDNKISYMNAIDEANQTPTFSNDVLNQGIKLYGDSENSNAAMNYYWSVSENEDLFIQYCRSTGISDKQIEKFIDAK